ncbi:MAG: hypothetical protein HFI85_01455 [Clostridia bacterium]|jgi:stage III sporulation protein AG|nr:hypothetical protein [Clostridia bacterium]
MTSKIKDKFRILFERIKKVKHFEIYIAVGLAIIIAVIYFSFLKAPSQNKDTNNKIDNVSSNFSSSGEYIDYLENKLENVITLVKGAGNVEVVVTLEKGFEYVYATEEETRTTANGTTITTSNIVMVNGKPVIKEEIYPVVQGIVIVASGANNVSVKMDILSIVQTVIEIENSKINIYAGN